MNLKQKKIAREQEEKVLTPLREKLKEIAGKELTLEVDFASVFAGEQEDQDKFFAWYEKMAIMPFIDSVKNLCEDPDGKEAVAETLKGFKVKNNIVGKGKMTMEKGILVEETTFSASQGVFAAKKEQVQDFLEENL